MYVPPSVEAAKTLARACGVDQIAIWTFSEKDGQHVTTWGEPMRHSLLAAEAGNHIQKAAGWPENYCQALPLSLVVVWAGLDTSAAAAIADGTLEKRQVLAVLHLVREAFVTRDPKLAEQLIAEKCEAAEEPES